MAMGDKKKSKNGKKKSHKSKKVITTTLAVGKRPSIAAAAKAAKAAAAAAASAQKEVVILETDAAGKDPTLSRANEEEQDDKAPAATINEKSCTSSKRTEVVKAVITATKPAAAVDATTTTTTTTASTTTASTLKSTSSSSLLFDAVNDDDFKIASSSSSTSILSDSYESRTVVRASALICGSGLVEDEELFNAVVSAEMGTATMEEFSTKAIEEPIGQVTADKKGDTTTTAVSSDSNGLREKKVDVPLVGKEEDDDQEEEVDEEVECLLRKGAFGSDEESDGHAAIGVDDDDDDDEDEDDYGPFTINDEAEDNKEPGAVPSAVIKDVTPKPQPLACFEKLIGEGGGSDLGAAAAAKASESTAPPKTKKELAMERKAAELAEARARAQANSVRIVVSHKRDIWEHVLSRNVEATRGAIQRGCDPDEADDEGRTPLMIACALGDRRLVSFFLKEAEPKASLSARAIAGWTPLMIACGANHLEIVQELIDAGADLTDRDSEFGSTPLMWACGGGHVEVVKYLVEGPCSSMQHILCKNDDYWTPLMITSDGGYIDCVKILVEAGAILDDFSMDGRTALDLAKANGNRVVEKYLEARHAVSKQDYWKAVDEGDAARVQELLATSGHLVDVTNDEGRSALLLACLGGHKDLVCCLVEAGAKVDFQDPNATSAVDVAVVLGRLDLVKYLASIGGANLNLTNSKGWTPLMQAIMVADMNIIRYLVDCGAAVNTCNGDGDTVYDVAVKMHRTAIAQYLETKGAFSAKDVRKQIEAVQKGERGVFKLW